MTAGTIVATVYAVAVLFAFGYGRRPRLAHKHNKEASS